MLFHEVGVIRYRPGELEYAVPRAEARSLISNFRRGFLWSSFRFQLPDQPKLARLNVQRMWRSEMDRFIAELTERTTER